MNIANKITNEITIGGYVRSDFSYSHTVFGENFYNFQVAIPRTSGVEDCINAMVSDRLIDITKYVVGDMIKAYGQVRTFSKDGRLKVFVFITNILDNTYAENNVYLDGYICKIPTYRTTPFGKEISDLLLAVNRGYGKSDYIPCIAWGRNARFMSGLEVGTNLQVCGRIQSREYRKKLSEEKYETRVAYEVSLFSVKVACPDEEREEYV